MRGDQPAVGIPIPHPGISSLPDSLRRSVSTNVDSDTDPHDHLSCEDEWDIIKWALVNV